MVFYPVIIVLLFVCTATAQNMSETRSIGYGLGLESAAHSNRPLETQPSDVAVPALSVGVGMHSKRVTPTSQKGELPVHGKPDFTDPPQNVEKVSFRPERVLPNTFSNETAVVDDAEKVGRFGFSLPRPEEQPPFHPRHFKTPYDEYRPVDDDDKANGKPKDRFHWRSAIEQSLMIQGVQHGYALLFQEKTRRALKGKFFEDYIDSIKGLRGWSDGNKFFTNYIAHPMQGAMTGFIFLQNHDRMKKQKFGESKQYWKDRFKAFVWSTAWSTNWELGPISQSSIGNVGLYDHQGYVDFVMTPTAGTGWMVMEEALDRYIIRHIEKRSAFVSIFARMLLNPMRSVANVLRVKKPWYRDRPFGD